MIHRIELPPALIQANQPADRALSRCGTVQGHNDDQANQFAVRGRVEAA